MSGKKRVLTFAECNALEAVHPTAWENPAALADAACKTCGGKGLRWLTVVEGEWFKRDTALCGCMRKHAKGGAR